jgi:hypothetical protein
MLISGAAARASRRVDMVGELDGVMQPHLATIRGLDPDAVVGLRGSLASGLRSQGKGPFDPGDFDVDAFIVSDRLAGQFRRREWWRSGSRIGEIDAVQRSIDSTLRQSPNFAGMRSDPFTFRIYTQREWANLQRRSDSQYIFGGGN